MPVGSGIFQDQNKSQGIFVLKIRLLLLAFTRIHDQNLNNMYKTVQR